MQFYSLHLCGLVRSLPVIYLGPKTKIASFSLLGDGELVNKTSVALSKKLKKINFDFLIGPEVKVVPLIQELSNLLNKKEYVICRKSIKPYMVHPIVYHPENLKRNLRSLVIDGKDAELLKNKKVIIVDDVVSTGTTIEAIKTLMTKVGAKVVAASAVLKQGDIYKGELIFLGKIPVFGP
jgi:adenine phosphoribosyltransferase